VGIGRRQLGPSTVWSERDRRPTIAVEVIAMLSDRELRELVEEHLKEEIAAKLHDGASRAQVVAALVEEGFVPRSAERFVDAVMRALPEAPRPN
jgi:hypothetical protein